MRCGCISLGDIHCDGCQRTIHYLGRYLAVEDEAEDIIKRFCVDCALSKGYAHYKQEKGEQSATFFSD
jgi:predicted Fe-S protein YdhL (DUF1289 family)